MFEAVFLPFFCQLQKYSFKLNLQVSIKCSFLWTSCRYRQKCSFVSPFRVKYNESIFFKKYSKNQLQASRGNPTRVFLEAWVRVQTHEVESSVLSGWWNRTPGRRFRIRSPTSAPRRPRWLDVLCAALWAEVFKLVLMINVRCMININKKPIAGLKGKPIPGFFRGLCA
jgi:hypothetical protein